MGVWYYLARDDNHSLYELEKVQGWREAFSNFPNGHGEVCVRPDQVAALATSLRRHSSDWGYAALLDGDYLDRVAADIVRWSDGHPFVFISEYDHRIDGNYPDTSYWLDYGVLNITGSRFSADS